MTDPRLFYGKPLWEEVAAQMAISESELKARLRLIIDRRNKIAPEADADPSFPGARWPISRQDGEEALSFHYFVVRGNLRYSEMMRQRLD